MTETQQQTVEGLDVSSNQPVIDGQKVAASGRAFSYVRVNVGEGGADPMMRAHADSFRSAGLLVGGYHFCRPDEDAKDDVEAFARACGSVELSLPPAADLEIMNDRSATQVLEFTEAWISYCVEILGRKPFIYTGPNFWHSLGARGLEEQWASFDLWVSNYGRSTPIVPAPWKKWTIWQYAANKIVKIRATGEHVYGARAQQALANGTGVVIAQPGIIPGVAGEVDANRFNGSLADLYRFAGLTATAEMLGESAGSKT